MASDAPVLLFSANGYVSLMSLNVFIGVCAFSAIFVFWLRPGGLAWSASSSGHGRDGAIPGPSGFPLVGMVFAFTGSLTHRVLAKLSRSMNAVSLMAFSVGFTRFIISSHPDTAKEILKSSAFADRPVKESAYQLLFNRAMGFAPYGEYWRNLRRISATHLFSPFRVTSFGEIRRLIGTKMVEVIESQMKKEKKVEVRKVLRSASLQNVMATVFGKQYEFGDSGYGVPEIEILVNEGYDLLGIFNWSDHFPFLSFLDLQGVRRRCRNLSSKVTVFVGKIIEEHRARKKSSASQHANARPAQDFVDVLLGLEDESVKLGDSDMIAVLWEMIFRGTDTVAILLEWVLARMVMHPEIQCRARSEIIDVVGFRRVEDSDLPRLRYLSAIVKETLRVHPPGPLLSWARFSVQDTHVGSHFIPAGTTAMVNMWAIAHDEKFWPEPEKFSPERFIGENDVSILGSDLRLAPFGSGRRVCPGKTMGVATVQLWLAQLLQTFEWIPPEDGAVDLSESLKLSLEMKCPLICKAMCVNDEE